MPELIAALKANPGKHSYASPGVGTLQHLARELFSRQASVDAVHVPYKGAVAMMPDLMSGQVAIGVISAAVAIAQVRATPLNVPISLDAAGIAKQTSLSVCLVEVETADGRIGHGFTAITEEEVVAAAINEVAADHLKGEESLAHERIWEKLYRLLSPRGQAGYASHAIAAIDVVLWDLKGKILGQPVRCSGAKSRGRCKR